MKNSFMLSACLSVGKYKKTDHQRFIVMQDLEKYIFDPDNPTKFKAYKLLLKIVRDRANVIFFDENFLMEIFKEKIFDTNFENEIWDQPDNFSKLTNSEKRDLFIKNYSKSDFAIYLLNKNLSFQDTILEKLFNRFIGSKNLVNANAKPVSHTLNNRRTLKTYLNLINKPIESISYNTFNESIIFILTNSEYNFFIDKITSKSTSIIITTIENYFSISKKSLPKTLKPILLKKTSDIHILFTLLKRDLEQQQNKYKPKQPTSYLKSFSLKNYFCLKETNLQNFENQKEVYFIGKNGVGKTILLQALLLALKGNETVGEVLELIKPNFNQKEKQKLVLTAIDSLDKNYSFKENANQQKSSYPKIFAYGVNRFRGHEHQKDKYGYLTLFDDDAYLESPTAWLQYLQHKELSKATDTIPLQTAIDILLTLLPDIKDIEVTADKVTFMTKDEENQFGQLSHGYKSILTWVCDFISRLSKEQPYIHTSKDFNATILVDEIGMYLHPDWQYTIVRQLRNWFPNVQFIFTTHSPIAILGASKDAVFYKVYKEDGETKVGQAVENKSISYLMANGIITAPFLFDMETAESAAFDEEKDDLATDDDYIVNRVHEAIRIRLEKELGATPQRIMDLINEELDNFEAENAHDKN